MMKTVKIGNRTFEIGKVYDNPKLSAFKPQIKLTDILHESDPNWKGLSHEKWTKHFVKEMKGEKLLKKFEKKDFLYLYTNRYSDDDIFYGAITAFHNPTSLYAGDLFIAKWNGDSEQHLEGSVQVHPKFRRQQVATNMYNLAESYIGKKFKPATQHTDDARRFWNNRV